MSFSLLWIKVSVPFILLTDQKSSSPLSFCLLHAWSASTLLFSSWCGHCRLSTVISFTASSACFCCCTSLPRLNQKLTLLPCSTTSLLCGCRVQTLACCEATSSRVQLPFPCFCYSQLVLLQMRAVNAAMEDFCCHGSSFSSLQQLQVAFRR